MPTFALIDGNSFYCSAEQAFAPKLRAKPLVVLSNNDGCVIARSPEAKARGIKMGEPWHLFSKRPEAKGVLWRSSNLSHYGEISRRVYDVLAARVPAVEPYSIDEMFLDLTGIPEPVAFSRTLRLDVRQIAKIPTCVGIGPSKTLAKLANRIAKNTPSLEGVCDLRCPADRAAWFPRLSVGDVWGIGSQAAAKLTATGIETVADFVACDARAVRDMLTVTGARTHAELRGSSCLPLSLMPATRQGIAVTRTFGSAIETWQDLREAVCAYAARAAEKLRDEGLMAGRLTVFAHTNPHTGDPWHSAHRAAEIEPTADSGALIQECIRLLRACWRPGFRYSKAGVMLQELIPAGRQAVLFSTRDTLKSDAAMQAMDAINKRFGRETLRIASTGSSRPWRARQRQRSPRYTTRVDELLLGTAF